MDIGTGKDWPASALSNFAPYKFVFDGVRCNSMEGLLQSFKFKDAKTQREICKLVGREANKKGRTEKWQESQLLWWKGKKFDRDSPEYQRLLDKAFIALAENQDYKKALLATENEILTHSIGSTDPRNTILTQEEFCARLINIRTSLQQR